MIGHIPLLSTAASLLLLSSSTTALALTSPAQSANSRMLLTRSDDGINVNRACKVQHGNGFSAQAAGNGCNDWVCVRGNERRGVSMKDYCCGETDSQTCCNIDATCSGGIYGWKCWYGDASCELDF